MRRLFSCVSSVAVLNVAACSGSFAAKEIADAGPPSAADADARLAADAGSSPTGDAGPQPVVADAGEGGGEAAAVGMESPIALADAWVEGFYGTPYRGTNTYSNVDSSGYPTGYYVDWRGDPGVTLFANVSDCSSFSDTLLTRSFGWLPATSHPRPLAEDYYWAIRGGVGFTEIDDIEAVKVGDVIALLYPPGGTDTGHVAWVDAVPAPFSGAPEEPGLAQYVVTVIDSTNGFHDGVTGPSTTADDRYLGRLADGSACSTDTQCITLYGPNAVCNTTSLISDSVCSLMGVGRGQMRLFVDAAGQIQGHTWSPNPESTFYPRPSPLPVSGGTFSGEDIVVGRVSAIGP